MTMNRDEIYGTICEVMIEALGVDDDEITMEAVLTTDLGAESIDFLDIVFRLEKSFDIKIEQGELFPDNVAQNPDYVQDGKVTDKGLAELKEKIPHADFTALEADRSIDKVPEIFTVEAIVRFVENKLAAVA